MSRATPKMRKFAERLIAIAAKGGSVKMKKPGASLVCETLRPHLAVLMGNSAFRLLLFRALALADEEIKWLPTVYVSADGSLGGLDELAAQLGPDEVAEGSVVLVAQLLGLLVAFIGENLTVRLVREVWPRLSFNDLDSGDGVENEKAR